MITGKIEKKKVTAEEILLRVSPYDIFRHFAGDFKVNVPFKSPIPGRGDEHPSFIIGDKYGELYYYDFGDANFRGDCFDFVKKMRGCFNFQVVLNTIDSEMGLGIGDKNKVEYRRARGIEFSPIEKQEKKHSVIKIKTRKFTTDDLAYWNMFHQDIEDLKREEIYSIEEAWLNGRRMSLEDIRFAYVYDGVKIKIYQPFAEKKRKWPANNVPHSRMDGLEFIKNVNKLLILSSKKDKMVCRKILQSVTSTQSECITSINEDNMKYIKENSIEQWMGWDNDETGIKSSQYYVNHQGFHRAIYTPDELLPGIKDWADYGKEKGIHELYKYFTQKGLI